MMTNPEGFEVINDVLDSETCDRLIASLPPSSDKAGRRDLLRNPAVRKLTRSHVLPLVSRWLGPGSFAVSATLFEKSPAKNWKVSWHQDLSVAATGPGVVAKDGIPHIQPGPEILSRLLGARVHLDAAGVTSGGLVFVPGSHLLGPLPEDDLPRVLESAGHARPDCPRGSVLLMRPLLLHSSSAMTEPVARRVVHIVCAPQELQSFAWFQRLAA